LTCALLVILTVTQNVFQSTERAEVCTTQHCVSTAAQIISGIDPTADPCDDFFQYACGTWNKIHVIPEDKTSYNPFEKLHDELQLILKRILEEPKNEYDTNATEKAKILYASCMNLDAIYEVGDRPLREVIDSLGGWPVLDDQWAATRSENWTLEVMIGRLRGTHHASLLVEAWVAADDKNSSVNVIQLDQPPLGLPSREYFLKESDSEYKAAYLRFMINVAKLLGADDATATRDMEQVLHFEEQLANVTMPQSDRHDTGVMYTKLTVKQLQQEAPELDWLLYFNTFMPTTITDDEPIVSMANEYLKEMAKLVSRQEKRVLANYLIWMLMMDLAPETTVDMHQQEYEYRKVLQGVTMEQVRWQKCVDFVNDRLGMAVGRLFVKENFQKESRDTALEMIHNIRTEFIKILDETDWMDDETKIVAKEKANAMIERIGYPPSILNDTELDEMYKELQFNPSQYFLNILTVKRHDSMKDVIKLRKPIDKEKWEQQPAVVNAFYNPNTNEIAFPAGILQPIFYSHQFPKSLNYGGIGVVIGHEITHGFDDKGRQYDKDGNLRHWWNNETIKAFRERAQCIVNQYSGYVLEQLSLNIDGKNTQGENIADNGGLKESFRAYREWVRRNGEEPPLPGITLTHDQLFFLKYAQIWCGIMRDEEALHKLRTSVHSPGPVRVLGPLSNSYDFAEAYRCPVGSRMNPAHKCLVW
jgi:membrane metallo-endopeptidase-like protein 1